MSKFVSVVLALTYLMVSVTPVNADQNGGSKCAVCTLVVALVQQASKIHNRTITEELDAVCGFFEKSFDQDVCKFIVQIVGPKIVPALEQGATPDVACNLLKLCVPQTAVCRLFPKPNSTKTDADYEAMIRKVHATTAEDPRLTSFNICKLMPAACSAFQNHLPGYDADGDRFSTHATFRGYDWRGMDCNDSDASVFPGRHSTDATRDTNCNGIYGVNPATKKTYEQEWCEGTGAMGVAVLGDSATAHFRIPANYVTGADFHKGTYDHAVRLVENEGDWPMLSWGTGFYDNTTQFHPDIHGPVMSLYKKMKTHNQCNHNDYQNLGVNGASVENLVDWVSLLARNGTNTKLPVKPLLTFFSMIGNDVCNHAHNFNEMTTPQEYYNDVLAALQAADAKLPNGSVVILVPLVDGRILYNSMHNRIHPIGKYANDVNYDNLYDFLNCLHISPCWGWMNTNATVRNTTYHIRTLLNDQLPLIVNNTRGQFKNIRPAYLGNVLDDFFHNTHIPHWMLIEPVDGFHPSQLANAHIAEALWNATVEAGLLPPPNPNNAAILAKFGERKH